MNMELLNDTLSVIRNNDDKWMKRRRKIDSEIIFKSLICSAISDIGVSSCLLGFDINVSHVAMIKARQKLDDDFYKNINAEINQKLTNHIYAIDGSKIRVHENFKLFGYKSRTNDQPVPRSAKRPLAMLSSLYGVESQTTANYVVTTHFNERACVSLLIKDLGRDDIVIMDRGYYSAELYEHFYEKQVHALFRLKKDANKTVKGFYLSQKTELNTYLVRNGECIPIRYIKYFIEGEKYIVATTITDMSSRQIKQLYILRWGIETSYKRIKSYHNINNIYARTHKLWLQEVQVRILYDTLLIKLQSSMKKRKRKTVKTIAYGAINLKMFCYLLNMTIGIRPNGDDT